MDIKETDAQDGSGMNKISIMHNESAFGTGSLTKDERPNEYFGACFSSFKVEDEDTDFI